MFYHVWFVTKCKRNTLVGEAERIAKDSFLEVARNKDYKILAIETNRDHAHMLIEADDKYDLANKMRVLKSVSAKKIFDMGTPHSRAGNVRHFWARGFGRKIVYKPGLEEVIRYIRDQKIITHNDTKEGHV